MFIGKITVNLTNSISTNHQSIHIGDEIRSVEHVVVILFGDYNLFLHNYVRLGRV